MAADAPCRVLLVKTTSKRQVYHQQPPLQQLLHTLSGRQDCWRSWSPSTVQSMLQSIIRVKYCSTDIISTASFWCSSCGQGDAADSLPDTTEAAKLYRQPWFCWWHVSSCVSGSQLCTQAYPEGRCFGGYHNQVCSAWSTCHAQVLLLFWFAMHFSVSVMIDMSGSDHSFMKPTITKKGTQLK